MSGPPTDPALVAAPTDDLEAVPVPVPTPPRERNALTLDQRRALRNWANGQGMRPSHKACIDWFYAQYGQLISQSTVSHSLSSKYSRLDGEHPQLSGSRLRFGNWPDVERLVLLWYQQAQASGRQPTNEELGDKAKTIFCQLPRYKDDNPPEFSPGWIHRFKKRYGLLSRRARRNGSGINPADDIDYLAECVPRFMAIAPDTSPTIIKEQVLRVIGVEPSLSTCALVRDEIIRRIQHPPPPPPQPLPPPEDEPLEDIVPPPEPEEQHEPPPPMYAEDAEIVLQNALRQLQQEEQAAEEQAAAVREEHERQQRAAMGEPPPPEMVTHTEDHDMGEPQYETPTQDMTADLTLTPIHSDDPMATHEERSIRCPFCVNQRMLRSIKEAVEHMSTHVVV